MKLTDIPPHVTDLNPPWFFQEIHKKYKISIDSSIDDEVVEPLEGAELTVWR